jgi:ATP-dependent Clp protease ATP-binding subunit ClpC
MMEIDSFNLTPKAKLALKDAKEFANRNNHSLINNCHVLYGCWKNINSSFINFANLMGVELSIENLSEIILKFAKKHALLFTASTHNDIWDVDIQNAIKKAKEFADDHENFYIGIEHLLFGVLECNEKFLDFLLKNNIDYEHLKEIIHEFIVGKTSEPPQVEKEPTPAKKTKVKAIEAYCTLLNDLVKKDDYQKISSRDKEIETLTEILCRKTKSNCLLLGEPGTGKTAIVEGLAQKINSNECSEVLANKKIYSLDLSLMIAGTKYRGQFEERFSNFLEEVKELKDTIIFIDEIHVMIGAGSSEGSMDVANMLKPALARGDIRCIGATTYSEYKKFFEKDGALSRRFDIVKVNEPNRTQVFEMVKASIDSFETYHNVEYSDELINLTIDLCGKYLPNKRFPDKAFDVIDQTCSKVKIKKIKRPLKALKVEKELKDFLDSEEEDFSQEMQIKCALLMDKYTSIMQDWMYRVAKTKFKITENDVYEVIANKSNVNVDTIKESANNTFALFKDNLKSKIFGQSENIDKIYETLACSKAGFNKSNRPIANFFFVGPTSVGKTFAAKQIAKEFFGNESSILQINMSEYQEQNSISKLIGTSAGYVGFEEGGLLTEFVRHNPNSVILFDEAEKCHRSILDLLLQILDEGSINDNLNRKIDFTSCILILTSNIGVKESETKSMGFIQPEVSYKDSYKDSVKKQLRPELVARIDEIIVFNALTNKEFTEIVNERINQIKNNLNSRKIKMTISKDCIDYIVNKLNGDFNARSLNSIIRSEIEVPIADLIIKKSDLKKISIKVIDKSINIW